MEKVSVFLSITGLVWCALFALIMIGVVFLIKRNSEREYDTNNKLFLILYIITMILIIMEFILQNAIPMYEKAKLYPLISSINV